MCESSLASNLRIPGPKGSAESIDTCFQGLAMLKRLACFLRGGHDYGVFCGPAALFLRCRRCSRRSPGWSVAESPAMSGSSEVARPDRQMEWEGRVLPFGGDAVAG
jgi:hypothetical protein